MNFMKRTAAAVVCLFAFLFSAAGEEASLPENCQKVVVTFLGDCTLGNEEWQQKRPESFVCTVKEKGFDYPFSGVLPVLSADDLTVANLENVFHDSAKGKTEKTYNFRAPSEYAKILPLGSVECVSIANNHIDDYGKKGALSTISALENENIPWFGTTEYADNVYIYEKGNIKIGFISIYISQWWKNPDALKKDFETLYDAQCNMIAAVMHGGVEYDSFRDPKQEKLANYLIRKGADVVVGHHPHILQGADIKDGATVLYSIGNFVFGGNRSMRAYQTVIPQFTFCFDENGTYLGQQLNLIPAHYSSSKEKNDYRPVLVTGEEAQDVIQTIQKDSSFKLRPYIENEGAVQAFVPAGKEK